MHSPTTISRTRNFITGKHTVIDGHTWIDIKSLETICVLVTLNLRDQGQAIGIPLACPWRD